MVAGLLTLHRLESIVDRRLLHARHLIDARSPQGRFHRLVDGIVLMIGGYLLDCLNGGQTSLQVLLLLLLEHRERLHQIQ